MKSIVVGTDFSQGSYVALDYAVTIANNLNCDIRLVWVRKEKKLFDSDQMETATRLAEQQLESLCQERAHILKNNAIHWEIIQGKVANVIADVAKKLEAPVIVIGTNGASGFEKYWMGSTAVRIVQESPCPVLTIREGFDFRQTLDDIVVPIRVHINSRQKIGPASEIARLSNSNIHILGLSASSDDDSDLKTYIKQIEKYMQNKGVRMSSEIRRYSNYADTVLEVAEKRNSGLVVINTEQDKVLAQLFLGTNAQQIVHHSQIPVLCLHPKDIANFER